MIAPVALLPYMLVQKAPILKEPVSDISKKNLFAVISVWSRISTSCCNLQNKPEVVTGYRICRFTACVSSQLAAILKLSQAAQQAKSLKITNKVLQYYSNHPFNFWFQYVPGQPFSS